jgi:hypothetical protein
MQISANDGKIYTLHERPKWHKGPPPSIGWWPASVSHFQESLRWWDGECWSIPVSRFETSRAAGKAAQYKEKNATSLIEWTDRWW